MKIDLVFPILPPAINGIGDHTAFLSAKLSESCQVRILTSRGQCTQAVPGVAVERVFSVANPRDVRGLLPAIQSFPPDWLILQFEQFSYGRWGFNPYLPVVMQALKRSCPGTRIALMAHEDFVPVTSWKFVVMTMWQRCQFWMLGRCADLILCSTEPWVERYQNWFPATPVRLAPVGSNIPFVPASREEVRRHLGIDDCTFVLGMFGSVYKMRNVGVVRETAKALQHLGADVVVLYIGTQGSIVRDELEEVPCIDKGPLPAAEVSRHFAAMDVLLAPFYEGAATRRGTFIAGLQHGTATVTTKGPETGALLSEAHGKAFMLAEAGNTSQFVDFVRQLYHDDERRRRLAAAGRSFYTTNFSWDMVARRFLEAMLELDGMAETPVSA